jgi:hypothetical protein
MNAALDGLQRWMLDALIAPEAVDRSIVDTRVLPGARIDAAACLAIYQRSYLLRLRHCLGGQFPALRHALGEQLFDDFADTYLRACPSRSHTLFELGARFAEWMEADRPDRDLPAEQREAWVDFMIDLADYEYSLFRLFDAPGHEGRPWPDAASDDAELVLQPCLALRTYRFPVAWYYHEVREARGPALPPRAPSHLVLLRRDHRTVTCPVTPLHHRFLQQVREFDAVPAALDAIVAHTGRPREEVHRSWREDVREGWIEAGFFVARRHREAHGTV